MTGVFALIAQTRVDVGRLADDRKVQPFLRTDIAVGETAERNSCCAFTLFVLA